MVGPFNDDVRLAHLLADDADSLAMDRFRAPDLQVQTKSDLTPVSDADAAVEQSIRRTLARARSRDAVSGEEEEPTGWGPRRWVVDPIDGTANYIRGVPVWATLIALAVESEVVVGCVSAPALGRRWWASQGGGAWTGRSLMAARPCHVSAVDDIADASFSYASLGGWEQIGRLDSFLALTRRCWRTRAYGDFWSYTMLAEGAVDVAADPQLAVHDMAALDVIVREAGGRFTGLDGRPGPLGRNALATNGHLHDAAMAFLGHFPDGPDEPPARPGGNVRDLASRRRGSD